MKLRTLLVDDEPLALEGLRLRLAQLEGVEVVAECDSGKEAIDECARLAPDLVFLDMDMPGLSGLEVAEELKQGANPAIIFVTAHQEYAVSALDLGAEDYLLKPASLGRLRQAVERARQKTGALDDTVQERLLTALHDVSGISMPELQEWLETDGPLPIPYPEKIAIKNSDNDIVMVPARSIDWIDAAGDYMCIHVGEQTHILRITLKKLQQLLDPKLFFRIHKSTIVNGERVQKIIPMRNNECILELEGEIRLKASRNYRDQVQALKESAR
ncbi:LytTR family DNA-binding domain-containing protein [Biformimicrobium ophioploci]|uniref:LytTR family DNA-binding domain-containing protein n=2 Tax=Biformimicrobium ophioploci TaxID=3036711 RepID=A0ABQ6M0V0_9GAMM|nr:LytTR family DNA-binding domain-containing protein [Microbulbifer sp. NKW57]